LLLTIVTNLVRSFRFRTAYQYKVSILYKSPEVGGTCQLTGIVLQLDLYEHQQ